MKYFTIFAWLHIEHQDVEALIFPNVKNFPHSIIRLLLAVLSTSTLLFPLPVRSGKVSDDHKEILKIVDKGALHIKSIKTLKSRIVESLEARGGVRRFTGVYTAGGEGRFKVYFIEPYEQLVVCTGKELYWYIPDEETVWLAEMAGKEELKRLGERGGGVAPLEPESFSILRNEKEFFDFRLEGEERLFGLLKGDYRVTMTPKKGDVEFSKIEMVFDRKKTTLKRTSLFDLTGELKITEEFKDYRSYSPGLYFPRETRIGMKTPSGIQSITTIYIDPEINIPIDDKTFFFRIPEGVKRKPLFPGQGKAPSGEGGE